MKKSKLYVGGLITLIVGIIGCLVGISDFDMGVLLFYISVTLVGTGILMLDKEKSNRQENNNQNCSVSNGILANQETTQIPNKYIKKWLLLFLIAIVLLLLSFAFDSNGDNSESVYSAETTTEKVTEISSEQTTEKITEKLTELMTEQVTEKPTEELTEEPTEIPTQEATEKATEKVTEKITEVVTEKLTETPTGLKADISFNYSDNVPAGSIAWVEMYGAPNTEYSITVRYSSGLSTASGLEPKFTDDNGYVRWEWEVGAKTKEGSYPITISGGGNSASAEFNVI